MVFKTSSPSPTVPDTPDQLLRELPRRTIPDVLPHQREVMRKYATLPAAEPDVAMQLPTGSGKTLVGLLIGEWRRRKSQERVVYLCPTKQLVNQVVEQATEKYGLDVRGFIGRVRDYDATSKAEYRNADAVAVTTYSSLFNTNPFFDDADVIIVDDAHAAESYIADLWTLRIDANEPEHAVLHAAICNVLDSVLDPFDSARAKGKTESTSDRVWVDKIPTPIFASIRDQIRAVLNEHVEELRLKYAWSMVVDHLDACHLYVSSHEILIRPLICPTWTHGPFADARQRIFMSATLGAGGDLERLTGRRAIRRLPVPEGWDRQGVGRRFFIFPEMTLTDAETTELRRRLMKRAGRSLVLVPSLKAASQIIADISQNLGFSIFDAESIEESKKPFVAEEKAVAVIANRYDGIDFPGNECRLLFIEGLPRATNLQERFIMSRMGANVLFNERIQTRILQATGRCTRSLEDFSAVVVSGDELPDYLADIKRRKFLHPELQAEIAFGVDQSKGTNLSNLVDNFDIFLKNGKQWEAVNQQIIAARATAIQSPFPAIEDLGKAVHFEIEYQERIWQGDHEEALAQAESVLGTLSASELRGYRAMWEYLAGSAAWLGAEAGVAGLRTKARTHFKRAKESASGIPWLVGLSRFEGAGDTSEANENAATMSQVERLEGVLAQLGTLHDRSFAKREKEILGGLLKLTDPGFEEAHKLLGEFLGFEAGRVKGDGVPDTWWIAGNFCLVFEDHAEAGEQAIIDVKKARQASTHPAWIRAHLPLPTGVEIVPVLVTPAKKASEGAIPHLTDVTLWDLKSFREWAVSAISTVRTARKTFVEAGDIDWRAQTAELLEEAGIDVPSLVATLKLKSAAKFLAIEKLM